MKKELYKEIKIPEEVEVEIEGSTIIVKGKEGENKRRFNLGKLKLEIKGKGILIGYKLSTKKEKRAMNTIAAHIKNMIKGVQTKFEYKLKICFSHFPITVNIEGRKTIIKNFLGEKIPRKVEIPENVEVEVKGDIITIKSINKELAGQAAANFERATKIRNRDRRIFQDGIYITTKADKEM